MQPRGVDPRLLHGMPSREVLKVLPPGGDEVHAVDELEYPQRVESEDYVLGHDRRFPRDVHDAHARAVAGPVEEEVDYGRRPVGDVGLLKVLD